MEINEAPRALRGEAFQWLEKADCESTTTSEARYATRATAAMDGVTDMGENWRERKPRVSEEGTVRVEDG